MSISSTKRTPRSASLRPIRHCQPNALLCVARDAVERQRGVGLLADVEYLRIWETLAKEFSLASCSATLPALRSAIGSMPDANSLRASEWRFLANTSGTSGYFPKVKIATVSEFVGLWARLRLLDLNVSQCHLYRLRSNVPFLMERRTLGRTLRRAWLLQYTPGRRKTQTLAFARVMSLLKDVMGSRKTSSWRRDRDSNPGYLAVYTLSKRAPSATRPSLHRYVPGDTTTFKIPYRDV